jgi:acetyltransferase-like isoleucine patch superfamily enzyme
MIGEAKTASPPKRHWKEVEKARLHERFARFVIRSLRLSLGRVLHPRASFGRKVDLRRRFCLRQARGAEVIFGDRCVLDNDLTIECQGRLEVGSGTIFGHHCTIGALEEVIIGNDCLIAEMVSIRDHNHRFEDADVCIREQGMSVVPVRIGNNVWLGCKVTVVAGVTIGDNTIVGSNAVVTHDLPPNTVAVGVPARVIRQRAAPVDQP